MLGVDLLAALAASLASFAFGALWYSPVLLLAQWGKEAGVDTAAGMRNPTRVFVLAFLFTVLGALVLSAIAGPQPGLARGLGLGAALGLAVAAASLGINYQFAGRSAKLLLIDGGFHILRMTLMGGVVGVLQ